MSEQKLLFLTARPGAEAPREVAAAGSGLAPAVPGLAPVASGLAPAVSGPAPAAIFGVPLDRTTSYRSGTEAGPADIRAASWSLETYSPALGADLCEQTVYDFGDVALDRGRTLEADLEAIEAATADIVGRGLLPVILGGEHLLTLATYRGVLRGLGAAPAALQAAPATLAATRTAEPGRAVGWSSTGRALPLTGSETPLVVAEMVPTTGPRAGTPPGDPPVFFHFDAHADLREEFGGQILSHATVVRHVSRLAGPRNVYQFGIRSGEREEMLWGRANVNRIPGTLVGATREALRQVAGRQVYCSVDIDIFDPANAPGTGSPEPGGPPAADIFEAILAVGVAASLGAAAGGIDLVGFDLVEVSPPLDPSGRTTVLAAKLLREFLIARVCRAQS